MADKATPRNADFVGRVVKDAKSPPETRMLTGWLGDAAEEGERRLYTNAELSCYIDIPTDAILYTEPIRDSQPAGCVFVWVQRDAALKQGGSAASRAARFLHGQVQEDFASGASPEAAGLRCVTQVPCGEPTGFTGRCTKQPEVGGAWPCITAVPHCSEPTGFTGQCTHQPWPNPTQYIGCTIYHCPTHDLTHIPQICNIIATGMPGCPVVNPPEGRDPEAKASAEGGGAEEARAAVPVTSLPGCGYTRTWGLCPTLPPKCAVSVDIPCITRTETPQCRGIDLAAAGGQAGGASQICATNIGCNITLFCRTHIGPHCPPHMTPLCPATLDCPIGQFAAFRAAGPGQVIPDTQAPCSAVDTCPTRLGCDTKLPSVFCTQFPDACPTDPKFCHTTNPKACDTCCGPRCQTQPPACTQCNCTMAGPQCPSPGFECTMFCTHAEPQCPTKAGPHCPTLFPAGCQVSQSGPACPPTPTPPICNLQAGAQAFRAAAPIGPTIQAGAQCPTQPSGDCTFFGCPPTPATVCTQIREQCITQPSGDCTFFGCPPTPLTICTVSGPQCPPTPATVCTQIQQQCPTQPSGDCTFFNCPTVLCQARQPQGFAAAAAAQPMPTPPLTIPVWQCHAPTPATHCFICPTPHHSWYCPPPVTQTFICGGGNPSAVDACPTRLCPQGGQMRTGPFCVSNALICPAVTIVGINCVTPMR